MPVEETSNMLIMAAVYLQQTSASEAASYSKALRGKDMFYALIT
jgi:hypothetical protein